MILTDKLRAAVFDIDGTLAKLGSPAEENTVKALHTLEEKGITVVLCSGKPVYYMCGFARQLGLKKPAFIGENGGAIQFGIGLPPDKFIEFPYPEESKEAILELTKELKSTFPERIWYQPNLNSLTPFPYYKSDFPAIRSVIEKYTGDKTKLIMYPHSDCFDVQYREISKGTGVLAFAKAAGISPENIVSVGDWVNDYPMFGVTGLSLGVSVPDPSRVTKNFPGIAEALAYLTE